MSNKTSPASHALVEEEIQFTFVEFSHVCGISGDLLIALVDEGVLTPSGPDPQRWRFAGTTLRRARQAQRLAQDLELSAAQVALVLNLLDEIAALRAQLLRAGRL